MNTNELYIEEDEDEYEDDDYEDFLGEEAWEDPAEVAKIKAKYPGWYLVKVVNFREATFRQMKDWISVHTVNDYKEVGWNSGCSYTVGVVFEDHTDAIMFKLTWSQN